MKFDNVVGNPPYESKKNKLSGWNKFVERAYDIASSYISFVHPGSWRSPQNENTKYHEASQIIKSHAVSCSMHSSHQGKRVLGAETSYDWYILDLLTTNGDKPIKMSGYNGEVFYVTDRKNIPFISNTKNAYDIAQRITTNNEQGATRDVIYDRGLYSTDTRNNHLFSGTKTDKYKYPVIKTLPDSGPNITYTYDNTRGHFGIPKVIIDIFPTTFNPLLDLDGAYAMTHHSIAFPIGDKQKGELIKSAIETQAFKTFVLESTHNRMMLDYRMFNFLKEHWYEDVLRIENKKIYEV